MDKRKLVNIILKDLEEVRLLSEEVAEGQDGSLIEIELALNRAKLLIQELELLRELAGGQTAVPYHSGQEIWKEEAKAEEKAEAKEEEEEEIPEDQIEEDFNYPEPELEIINYEEDEFSGSEKLEEEEEAVDSAEEFEEDEDEDEKDEEEEDDDDDEMDEDEELTKELEEDEEQDLDEDDLEDEDWDEEDDDELEEELEEQKEEPTFEEVKPQPAAKIQTTELKSGPQEGFREINIDDMDDDEIEIQPIRTSQPVGSATRPPMREIPKPEDTLSETEEKKVVGEKYQKERSLNETLGNNKAGDSKLINGPITSLKAAINLNDRFLFIREIFNNNSAKYNEVIDNLDKMDQIQDAVEYLRDNLTMQKNEASMKFVELLKRRFTK